MTFDRNELDRLLAGSGAEKAWRSVPPIKKVRLIRMAGEMWKGAGYDSPEAFLFKYIMHNAPYWGLTDGEEG